MRNEIKIFHFNSNIRGYVSNYFEYFGLGQSEIKKKGGNLDNLLKRVFDGLGPIIGYRKDWTGKKEHSGVLDANIVGVHAKKVNSGSDKEFLGVEVELLHLSGANE